MDIILQLAAELKLQPRQVEHTVQLLDEGNTIPFIARYRKEATGELDETIIRALAERLAYLRSLESRRAEVSRLIEAQGLLTPEIDAALQRAATLQELEDLYRPFRPKRKTRASLAKERGLEPLAQLLMAQGAEDPQLQAEQFLSDEVPSVEAALQGARDILAEQFADDPAHRTRLRQFTYDTGILVTERTGEEDIPGAAEFQMYFDYREAVAKIPPHRILAINRGERLGVLKVKIQVDVERIHALLAEALITNGASPAAWHVRTALEDGYTRLLAPSLEREIRNALTEKAEKHAIQIFAKNLHNLLMQSPVRGRRVLGIDPAYRTGCKVVAVDEFGQLLEHTTIYPHEPQNRWAEALEILASLVKGHGITLITIGNGTASRETERLIAELIREHCPQAQYLVVSEAGASVYSASELAREEFPELDVSMRGAVSIARRVQDPLAELVKIEPKALGVGQYQHDVNQKELASALDTVVESCVNHVGVNLNSASSALLKYVSGLSAKTAQEIVNHRAEQGIFRTRA
ncbi:MAG TPA: Tex-like N-terminal domain-containing protein, partial [Limnochordia bacterium]|nr:Tex-like N-terminal domain-containing protein [Limnochordia bacterium]